MPSPDQVLRWWGRLYGEVARLPVTLTTARRLIVDLPDSIDRLTATLDATRGSLDAILPELSQLVGGMDTRLAHIDDSVAQALTDLDHRLGHMDGIVTELGGTLTGVLGSIPGLRRAVRSAPTTAPLPAAASVSA